ncbi:MAG: AAA family ATPase [Acidobacteria bacterium]|nr:AAA family ATPase [Acidobacteriota bacterium]
MYMQYFGFREIPFSLTPDPRFIFLTPSHRELMANLHYGIQNGKGLIVTTGEVGTGKTTILRWMLTRLDRSVWTSHIFNPGLTVTELYQQMAVDFGLGRYESKSEMLQKLGRLLMMRHSRGLRTVLIVDEAQGLRPILLEEIRLLLNFETYTEKQLQIILVGQPELRELLNSSELRQLKQRISLRCEVRPLKAGEISGYIRTRLNVAGAARLDLFTPDAVALIYRSSEGIPRLVNNICDNALLTAFAMNTQLITAEVIAEVAESLDLLQPMIEDNPRDVMAQSMPPLPVMHEESEADYRFETVYFEPKVPSQLKVISSHECDSEENIQAEYDQSI